MCSQLVATTLSPIKNLRACHSHPLTSCHVSYPGFSPLSKMLAQATPFHTHSMLKNSYNCSSSSSSNSAMRRECDACLSAAAVVYCRADAAALCAACDADIHAANPISHRHYREPLNSIDAQHGTRSNNYDAIFGGDDVDDYLDLVEFNSYTGQEQKQQMDCSEQVKNEYVVPVQTLTVSLSSMEASHTIADNTANGIVNSYVRQSKGPIQFNPADREARVLRYREKKKNRKFEKTIRYASRKAYAEARPRIKGRFAKRTNVELEIDQMFSDYVIPEEEVYGIVPTY